MWPLPVGHAPRSVDGNDRRPAGEGVIGRNVTIGPNVPAARSGSARRVRDVLGFVHGVRARALLRQSERLGTTTVAARKCTEQHDRAADSFAPTEAQPTQADEHYT